MTEDFETFTKSKAREFLADYMVGSAAAFSESERNRMGKADSELYWAIGNGHGEEVVSQEHASLLREIYDRHGPR